MEYHLQERDIDALLLAPERLEADQRKEFERHLATCSACRELMTFLHDAYDELHRHSTETERRVEEFVDRLRKQERIIELIPFRFVPDPAEFGEGTITVMAAHTGQQTDYKYSAVSTLISRDERSLVRILRDNELDRYRVFLTANDRPPRSRATIHFPGLGFGVTLAAEESQADLVLPPGLHDLDWTAIAAELRFSQD